MGIRWNIEENEGRRGDEGREVKGGEITLMGEATSGSSWHRPLRKEQNEQNRSQTEERKRGWRCFCLDSVSTAKI